VIALVRQRIGAVPFLFSKYLIFKAKSLLLHEKFIYRSLFKNEFKKFFLNWIFSVLEIEKILQ